MGKLSIQNILNRKDYLVVPLVGNKYCTRKPKKTDSNIKTIHDTNNKHDPDAYKVVSIEQNGSECMLGYIIKDYTSKIKMLYDKLKFKNIITKQEDHQTFYYIIYKMKDAF